MIVELKSYGWSWMGGVPDVVARVPDVGALVVKAQAHESDVLHPPGEVFGVSEDRENQGLAQRLAHRVLPAPPLGALPNPLNNITVICLGQEGRGRGSTNDGVMYRADVDGVIKLLSSSAKYRVEGVHPLAGTFSADEVEDHLHTLIQWTSGTMDATKFEDWLIGEHYLGCVVQSRFTQNVVVSRDECSIC